ncbi:MAG: hypothetical protein V1779_14545 [bacterium]
MISFHRVTRVLLTEPKATVGKDGFTNEILIHMEDMDNPIQLDLFSGNASSLRFYDNRMKTFKEIIREMAQSDTVAKGEEV